MKIRGKPSGGAQIGRTNRQPPDAFSTRRENGVGQRGGSRGNAGLTAAAGWFRARHDVDFDFARSVAHAQDLVVVEIALLYPSAGNGDLAFQGLRQAKIDGAFHLGFHTEWVDRGTAIDGADHAIHAKGTVLRVAGHFRDLGDVASPAKRGGDAAAAPSHQRLVPAGFIRGEFDHRAAAAHIERVSISNRNLSRGAKRGEQEFKRVAAGGIRSFVKETRDDKLVAGSVHGAPVAKRHAGFGDGEFETEIGDEKRGKVQRIYLSRGFRRNAGTVIKGFDGG